MLGVIRKDEMSLVEFLTNNPKLTLSFALIVFLIVLVVIFVLLRSKLKNQEKVLRAAKIEEERYRISH